MHAPPGRVVCFGEAMLRNSGDLESPGGSEYNVACALARLGVSASWVSALPHEQSIIDQIALDSGVHLDVRRSKYTVGSYTVDQEAGIVVYERSNSESCAIRIATSGRPGLLLQRSRYAASQGDDFLGILR